MNNLRIVLIAYNVIFRNTLKMFMESECNHTVVGEFSSINDFQENKVNSADLILMDIKRPEKGDYEKISEMTAINNSIQIIAITNELNNNKLSKIIESGFKACIIRDNITEEIKPAIRKVRKGESYFPYFL